jgi:hypothetical protein
MPTQTKEITLSDFQKWYPNALKPLEANKDAAHKFPDNLFAGWVTCSPEIQGLSSGVLPGVYRPAMLVL